MRSTVYGLQSVVYVFFHPRFAHMKGTDCKPNRLAYEMPCSVLVDLVVWERDSGQCQSVCMHSLCCGSFQITETWCGSLLPSYSQLRPFLFYRKTGGGAGISGQGVMWWSGSSAGTEPAFLWLLSAAKLPTLGCRALNSTLLRELFMYVCVCVCFGSMINPENYWRDTNRCLIIFFNCCRGTNSWEFTFKCKVCSVYQTFCVHDAEFQNRFECSL